MRRNRFDTHTRRQWSYHIVRDYLEDIWDAAAAEDSLVRLARRNHTPLVVLSERRYFEMMCAIDEGVRLRAELEVLSAKLASLVSDVHFLE